jgi:hypothetical protein
MSGRRTKRSVTRAKAGVRCAGASTVRSKQLESVERRIAAFERVKGTKIARGSHPSRRFVIPANAGIQCSIALNLRDILGSSVGAMDPGFRRNDGRVVFTGAFTGMTAWA